jgi:hypothetical protein
VGWIGKNPWDKSCVAFSVVGGRLDRLPVRASTAAAATFGSGRFIRGEVPSARAFPYGGAGTIRGMASIMPGLFRRGFDWTDAKTDLEKACGGSMGAR